MNKKLGLILRFFAFAFGTIILFAVLEKVYMDKVLDTRIMEEFKSLDKDTVEVLGVGASYAYTSFDTEVFWNEYGAPAYCISSGGQTYQTTYHYLKEAFKTQSPSVVCIEMGILTQADVSANEFANAAAVSWMPYLSDVRWDFIDKGVYGDYKDKLKWNLNYYHTRWKSLSNEDNIYFFDRKIRDAGYNPWYNINGYSDELVLYDDNRKVQPDDDVIERIDNLISLCESNEAVPVFYLSPQSLDGNVYAGLMWIKDYVGERGYHLYDYVSVADQLQLDGETDICNGHCSYFGAIKWTEYMAENINNNYNLIDHRGDERYSYWDENCSFYSGGAEDTYLLINEDNPAQYIEKAIWLTDAAVIITYDRGAEVGTINGELYDELRKCGLDLYEDSDCKHYVGIINGAERKLIDIGEDYYDKLELSGTDYEVYASSSGNTVFANGIRISANSDCAEPSVKLYLYDLDRKLVIDESTVLLRENEFYDKGLRFAFD